ncbi:MAG: hypothetical protein U9O86_06435 [Campylobacterota bacterium]|nr:hypothetical protein [Campylobacterota bacterium]
MQENLKIFDKIPYEVRIIKGTFLTVAQAEEAINDVLSDTSAFFKTPSLSQIIKVKSDNVYGVYKIIVTVAQGTAFPEYMLNARVAELEPRLVNVVFEAAELEQVEVPKTPVSTKDIKTEPAKEVQTPQPTQSHSPQGPNFIAQVSSQLGVTYKELSELIGYETTEVVEALSSGIVSKPMRKTLELCVENVELKKEIENSKKIKDALKEWLK